MFNYMIVTDDYASANQKIEEIKKSINRPFDITNYDIEEDGIYSIIDDITTVSLFDDPKMLIIKSSEEISKVSEKALNELILAMNDMANENALVFLFTKPDLKDSNTLKLKKYSTYIEILLKNIPFDEYVQKDLDNDGYTITGDALSLLISYVDSLALLIQSLDKLKSYKLDNKKITANDVKLLVTPPMEDNVYNLIEAVLSGNKKRVMECYEDLKLESVMPSYIVSLLINKFQEMYNVSVLLKANTSQNDIAEIFNVKPGRAYYMIKNAKSTTTKAIEKNLELLNKLDIDIKTGKIDQNIGLELYFLN